MSQPNDYNGHVPGYGQTVPRETEEVQVPNPLKTPPLRAQQHVSPTVQYTREQKGHSLVLHLLFGGFVLWIPTIYFACSPRHYFHA